MLSFLQHMLLEKKQEPDPSVLAGIHQYHVAAKLIAKQLQPDHPHSNSDLLFRHITKHFKNPKRPNFTHPDFPEITVNRYSTHGMDVVTKDKNIEVVGGGGKMLSSRRGVIKSPQGATDLLDPEKSKHLIGAILRNAINRKELDPQETQTRIGTSAWRRLTTRQGDFPGIVTRDNQGRHIGMKEIENHMAKTGVTHWAVGDHLIPVGNLSHFIHRIVITQKDDTDKATDKNTTNTKSARLAVRASGIVDPTSKEPIRIGTESNWHDQLGKLLTSWSDDKHKDYKKRQDTLERLKIEKI